MYVSWSILLYNVIAVVALMVAVWPFSVIKRDSSIVDVFWGLGFVLVAWNTFAHGEGYIWRNLLVVVLVTIWGFRLALHIYARNLGKGEDPRYQAFRRKAGDIYWFTSLFQVFLLQALLLWIISLSVQVAQMRHMPFHFTWVDFVGLALWITGFVFEAGGDYQLARFKANPANKGKVLDSGLWRYTRHPNYFGESLIWWGIFLIAAANPENIPVVISPALITFLLLKVSGVTLTEKTILNSKPQYEDYMRRTSAFIPMPPKEAQAEESDSTE